MKSYPFRHEWDRARYSQPWLCTRPSEAEVQKQILQLLGYKNVRAFAVDAGAKSIRGRARGALTRAGADPKQLGYILGGKTGAAQKGVTDVIGVLPGGRALFIEVKQPEWLVMNQKTDRLVQYRAAGEPTDDQLQFLTNMHSQGAVVGVCWATEDLEAILKGIANGRASPG